MRRFLEGVFWGAFPFLLAGLAFAVAVLVTG